MQLRIRSQLPELRASSVEFSCKTGFTQTGYWILEHGRVTSCWVMSLSPQCSSAAEAAVGRRRTNGTPPTPSTTEVAAAAAAESAASVRGHSAVPPVLLLCFLGPVKRRPGHLGWGEEGSCYGELRRGNGAERRLLSGGSSPRPRKSVRLASAVTSRLSSSFFPP